MLWEKTLARNGEGAAGKGGGNPRKSAFLEDKEGSVLWKGDKTLCHSCWETMSNAYNKI